MEHVHQHAATGLSRVVPPAGPVLGRSRSVLHAQEVERGDLQVADLAVVNDRLDRAVDRDEGVVMDRGERDPVVIGGRDDRVHVGRRQRQWLLAEQMLARCRRGDRDRRPNRLRRGHHHRVHISPRQQLPPVGHGVVRSQRGRDARRLPPLRRRVGHRHDLDAVDRHERREVAPHRDVAAAYDADAHESLPIYKTWRRNPTVRSTPGMPGRCGSPCSMLTTSS